LLSLLSLLVGLFIGLWLVLNNETASRQAIAMTMPRVNALIPGEIRYSSFHGAIGSTVVLEGVEVFDDRGQLCLRARRLEAEWDVWDLTRTTVDLRTVRLEEPEILISLRRDGTVNLVSAFTPPREDSGADSASAWTVVLRELSLVRGSLSLDDEDSSQPSLELENMSLGASYRFGGDKQSVRVDDLVASLVAPLALPELKLSGALSLDEEGLAASGVEISWRETELLVVGSIPDLSDPSLDLDVKVDRLALADIGLLAGESRLRGILTGDLHISGSSDALRASGALHGEEGSIAIEQLLLDRGEDVLRHEAKLTLDDIVLSQFLDVGGERLPSFSGVASWKGSGTSEQQLRGVLDLSVKPLEWRGHPVEVEAAKLLVEGQTVRAKSMNVLIAGGMVEGSGFSSLQTGEFSAALRGSFSSIAGLARFAEISGSSGQVSLETRLSGNWKSLEDKPVHSEGRASTQGLSRSDLSCEQVEATWKLDVGIGEGLASLTGPIEIRADRLLAQGLPPLARASLVAEMSGSEAEIVLQGSDGRDLVASLRAEVGWEKFPSVSVQGQNLEILAGDFLVQATEPFSAPTDFWSGSGHGSGALRFDQIAALYDRSSSLPRFGDSLGSD
jgi:hypothetical protein